MGQTYYYYYELDGHFETHDSTRPSTNMCPYMPGQTVNALQVPVEKTLRQRSASLTSIRPNDYMTMNPKDKFVTPRPAPPVPGQQPTLRLDSCPGQILRHKTSARSLSPTPTWRRFFGRSSRDEKDFVLDDARSISSRGSETSFSGSFLNATSHPSRASSRSRDISPESLLRFLSDDSIPLSPSEERPTLLIPDDIMEEIEDDEENFASSATMENPSYATCLSPPPFRRTESSATIPTTSDSTHTITEDECAIEEVCESPVIPSFNFEPRSRFSFSSVSSYAPSEAATPDVDTPSFYDSLDDDILSEGNASQPLSPMPPKGSLEQSYSLPPPETSTSKAPLLAAPSVDSSLDDLVAELGWMVDVIASKN